MSTADIALEDPTVSREHATLVHGGGRVVVTDLGSTNGTWVNDEQVIGSRELLDGDVLHFGSVEMRFSGQAENSGTAGGGQAYDQPRAAEVAGHGGPAPGPDPASDLDATPDQHATPVPYPAPAEAREHVHAVRTAAGQVRPAPVVRRRGAGRALAVPGVLLAVAGFAIWVYFVLSSIALDFDEGNPLDRQVWPGVPMPIAGFALLAGGGVLAAVGTGMSRAGRRGRRRR